MFKISDINLPGPINQEGLATSKLVRLVCEFRVKHEYQACQLLRNRSLNKETVYEIT